MAREQRVAKSRPRTEWIPGSAGEGVHGSPRLSEADFPGLGAELCLSAQIRKRHSSGSSSEDRLAACAREYVESLHQNSRIRLLYGKNNVLVQPVRKLNVHPSSPSFERPGTRIFQSHLSLSSGGLTREKGR